MTNLITFKTSFADHRIWNKFSWQVKDVAAHMKVKDYDGKDGKNHAWTEISIEEYYTPEAGSRQQSKTIHLTLNAEQRAELIAMLQGRI